MADEEISSALSSPNHDHRLNEILARLDLRDDIRETRADMRDIRERLTRMEQSVARLPGKGFVVMIAILALIVVFGLIAFQRPIASLVGQPAVLAPASASNVSP